MTEETNGVHDRLAQLTEKLNATEKAVQERSGGPSQPQPHKEASAYSKAVAAMGEFIGAIALCTLAGWGLDRWLGSAPWCMTLLLILGFVAGLWSAYKAVA